MNHMIIPNAMDIDADNVDGIKRHLLFSPSKTGNQFLRFAVSVIPPGKSAKPHTHPGDETALTLKGKATLTIEGKSFEINQNTAVLIGP